jgi:hypothetical protein
MKTPAPSVSPAEETTRKGYIDVLGHPSDRNCMFRILVHARLSVVCYRKLFVESKNFKLGNNTFSAFQTCGGTGIGSGMIRASMDSLDED